MRLRIAARRFFLMTTGLTALRLLLTQTDDKTIFRMSTNVTKDAFQAAQHSEFSMVLSTGNLLPLQLIECTSQLQSAIQECFTLLFQAPVDAPNEQSLSNLRHQAMGELLVPVKRNADGLFYEAVFNRLLK
jgi:hypothetical protein